MKNTTYISIFLHCIIVITGYWLLYFFDYFHFQPTNHNLINWDAVFLKSIVTGGYEYVAYSGTNLAFFPLFPLLWKVTGLSPVGISIFNAFLFLISLTLLLRHKQVDFIVLLILLSIPSFIFFAVPYSESLFFLFATCILIGYEQESAFLKNIGFLGASIVKSVSIIFIPAIIICGLLGGNKEKDQVRSVYISSLFSLLGLVVGATVQGIQTGQWFYFLEIQQYWGRHWIVPELPLVSSVAYDGVAFILGLVAIYFCLKSFISKLSSPSVPIQLKEGHVLFSALYLSATTFLDTFFTYNNGGGSLWSLNRHFLCTPFAIIFILWLIRSARLKKIDAAVILIAVTLGFYVSGIYRSWEMVLYYASFIASLLMIRIFPEQKIPLYLLYLFHVYVQLSFFQKFIMGHWIG